ncbi:hypothetical protein FQN52_000285 [Onygenales sp. PD_12]|nr:hypothetical protein FQN52_000285 [Onygenales sp. PD_12]
MRAVILLLSGLASAPLALAEFNFYAKYDEAAVTTTLGLSRQCLAALNQTVECDAVNSARAAGGADDDYWFKENVTALCTSKCARALTSWLSDVESQCAKDQIISNGRFIEPHTVPLKFVAGYDMACLRDSADNWCFLESQGWENFNRAEWGSDQCYGDDPPSHCENQVLLAPDDEPKSEMKSVVNMYSRDLFCSECFILMWRQRLLSPVLSPGNFTQYLVDEFNKIKTNCSADSSTATPIDKRADGAYYTAAFPPGPTQPGALKACGNYYKIIPGDTCSAISQKLFSLTMRRSIKPVPIYGQITLFVLPLLENAPFLQMGTVAGSTGRYVRDLVLAPSCNRKGRCEPCELEDDDEDSQEPTPADPLPLDPIPSDEPTLDDPEPEKPGRPDNSQTISEDGKCGPDVACAGSGFGECCSNSGFCGTGPQWCGPGNCMSGACDEDRSGISLNGTCGPLFAGNRTCQGSKFGNCCSTSGFCGTGPEWCGIGNCYSGACDTRSGGISTNGTCGPLFIGNMTCVGSKYGECCSKSGYCGSTKWHCAAEHCYSGKCQSPKNDGDKGDGGDKNDDKKSD